MIKGQKAMIEINAIEAISRDDLIGKLGTIDISVPSRAAGRTTKHVERWCICRLLSTLSTSDLLDYPLTVIFRDKPDIQLGQDTHLIGIEITEAVFENAAKIQAIRESDIFKQDDCFLNHKHSITAPKFNTKKARKMATQDGQEPWFSGQAEREWIKAMIHRIDEKEKGALKTDFQRYPDNWLLIYDNLSLPVMDLDDVLIPLFQLLNQRNDEVFFSHICIEKGEQLILITPYEIQKYQLVDLWL